MRARITLKDALMLGVAPLALGAYLLGASALDFYRISQYDDWWSWQVPDTACLLDRRLSQASFALAAGSLSNRILGQYESRESIRLEIDNGAWSAMTGRVAEHWGQWIEAVLGDGSVYQPVEVRLRGDASAHWTTPKKSLSIKTRKGELYRGQRHLNLTVKEVLPQYVSHSLADELGLLVTATEILPVFVNGRFHGLHRLMGRPDEHFIRHSGRMPGNVFRGDALLRGDRYQDQPRELFQNPNLWEQVASNDRPGLDGEGSLREWIAALNGSTFAEHQRFMARLDREELARLMALMLMCGDPLHMSGWHNQYWYEDPSSGEMHPIVWDLLIRRLGAPQFDMVVHPFWLSVLRDPRLFDRALELVVEWSGEGRFLSLAEELAREAEERHADALRYERYRHGVVPPAGNAELVLGLVRSNLALLAWWTGPGQVAWHAGPARDGTLVLDLVVSGRAGSVLEALFLQGAQEDVRLWADRDLNGELGPDDRIVTTQARRDRDGLHLTLEQAEPLLTGCTASGSEFVPEPLHYRFFLELRDEAGDPAAVVALRPELSSRFAERGPSLVPLQPGAELRSSRSWHPWQYALARSPAARVLSGEVHLVEDLVVAADEVLVIEPGTRIRIDPDVSILSRGTVLARGSEARPIVVSQAREDLPWGALALQGAAASGSRFEHVTFRGGGGAFLGGVEYKGAVAVHNVRDVVFEDCAFADNQRCDDLLNAVRSEVDLVGCSFERANGDAIDYDLSSGTIADGRISGSANDGIDLMACSPYIVSTRITGSGDKGVSIGEGSAPWIYGCEISGCALGLEVKDYSAPVILGSTVSGNELGVLQRSKSSYYAGSGRAVLAGSTVEGNTLDYEGADGARVTLCAARLGARGALTGEDLSWVRGWAGIDPGGPTAQVLAEGAFEDDFRDPADGWTRAGAVTRLQVRERDLVATFAGRSGAFRTAVDWSIPGGGARHVLVIEAASPDLSAAASAVTGEGEEVTAPLILDRDPGVARYTVIELSPGHYRWLVITGQAGAGGGKLRLHTWRVFALS